MLRKVTAQSVLISEKIATHAGINATALECLDLLRLEGRLTTPRRLASLTGLTTGAVTMLVDRLERAGFVRRVPNPEDRRSVLVEVLPSAAKALEPAFASLAEGMARVNKHYDNAALELVLDYLTRAHEAGAEHLAWLDRASLQSTSKRRRDASP
jgi:DNA-binding MarR family transcriptional regulator